MDEARPMQSYAQLRAYSGRAKGVRITSHGIAGLFQRDDEDTVAEDDGGATIVDASGRRWKRLIDSDVNITWFGAKKGQDSSAAIRAAINYVKTNGGVALAPAGEWLCKNIRLDGGTRGWALRGAGKKETVFKHIDGAGTLLSGSPGSAVPYTLQGFTIDCQHSVYNHPDANHGVSIPDSSGVRVIDVHVRDFKNCPILFFATVPNVYGDNQMIDCSADGLGVASNGFLFVDMDNCGYSRCYIKGLSKVEGIRSLGTAFSSRTTAGGGS